MAMPGMAASNEGMLRSMSERAEGGAPRTPVNDQVRPTAGKPRQCGQSPLAIAAIVLLAALLSACPVAPRNPPSVIYEPTVFGVVEGWEEIEGGGLSVRFVDGRQVTIATEAAALVGNLPQPTNLLLLDSVEAAGWFAAIIDDDLGCYVLEKPAVDDGTHILFDFGLRMPKAAGFDPGPVDDGRFPAHRESFCLSADAEVLGYGFGAP